jgi:hypothetical protein
MGTDIYLYAEQFRDGRWEPVGELENCDTRHYEFFAILANVRNPIRSTEAYDSITRNRGFPDDLSEEAKSDSLLMGGHDPGWATFREILEFDWNGKTIARTAVVDPSISHAFANGRFDRNELTSPYGLAGRGPGQRVTWTESYREAVGDELLKRLFKALYQIGTPENVRVIFSFDT